MAAQPAPSPAPLVGEKDAGLLAIVTTYGRCAYVSNWGARAITVIDLEAQQQADGIALAPVSPVHGLWISSGKRWFASATSRTIARYDPVARISPRTNAFPGLGQGHYPDEGHWIVVRLAHD